MSKRKLTCPCGTESRTFSYSGETVGYICEKTGFESLMTHGMAGILYFCPDCWKKAQSLGQELFKVVKDTNIYFLGLLVEKKRRENEKRKTQVRPGQSQQTEGQEKNE